MRIRKNMKLYVCAMMFALLLIDQQTVNTGVSQGMELCIKTIIPAVLPFLIISIWAGNLLTGYRFSLFEPIGKVYRIHSSACSLYLLSLLGGYPTGAKLVYDAYKDNRISEQSAIKLLYFCNNPGPGFIFGISYTLFPSPWTGWLLWAIQIVSSLYVSMFFDASACSVIVGRDQTTIGIAEALERAFRVMLTICGWVICFRILIVYLNRYAFRFVPPIIQTMICGVLELSNGCISLSAVADPGIRFMLCSAFLTFGGLCVCMQTTGIVHSLGAGTYVVGKILQTAISVLISYMLQLLCSDNISTAVIFILLIFCVPILFSYIFKKTVAFRSKSLYNT